MAYTDTILKRSKRNGPAIITQRCFVRPIREITRAATQCTFPLRYRRIHAQTNERAQGGTRIALINRV